MPKDRMGLTGRMQARVERFTPQALDALSSFKNRAQVEGWDPKYRKEQYENFLKKYRDQGLVVAKLWPKSFLNRLRLIAGRPMIAINHNIVTNEGDALIADLLQNTPERTKVDNSNGVIGVGTGFVSEGKTVDALVTQTGSNEGMDTGYPQTKGDWAAADDNVIVYVATFEAGDLNDTGIDEALLGNGTDTLAYAEINPPVDVSSTDTLEVTWEITLLGS